MGKTHELMSRIRSILNDSLSQCNRLTVQEIKNQNQVKFKKNQSHQNQKLIKN